MRRVAVVLFNLGGPDAPEAVRPFLENLFTDPAILRVPGFVRPWLGRFIAARRTKAASENYAILGGRSPLRELTEEQGRALEGALKAGAAPGEEHRCFIAMRYWHPFSDKAARAVRDWGATEVVLFPLYPQFSTTTTGSSIAAWTEAARAIGLRLPTTTVCCWHSDTGFADATAALLREAWDKARAEVPPGTGLRVLFSAHGLPESIVKHGDPYQWQVERTVAAVVAGDGCRGAGPSGLLPVPRHAAALDRAEHGRGAGKRRRRTGWRRWSAPSPSFPSTPKPSWNSTSSTASSRTSSACLATSARRRRTATRPSSPPWPRWCDGRGTANGSSAPSPAHGNARGCMATARTPGRQPRRRHPGRAKRCDDRNEAAAASRRGALRLRRRAGRQRRVGEQVGGGGTDGPRLADLGRGMPRVLPRHGAARHAAGDRGAGRPPAASLGGGADGAHRGGHAAGDGADTGRPRGRAGGGGSGVARRGRLQCGTGGTRRQARTAGTGGALRRPRLLLRGRGPAQAGARHLPRRGARLRRRRPATAWWWRTACSACAPESPPAAACSASSAKATPAVLAAAGAEPFGSMTALPGLLGLEP